MSDEPMSDEPMKDSSRSAHLSSSHHSSSLWGITESATGGMRNQVEGVLEQLGEPYAMKVCRRKFPWLPTWCSGGVLKQLTPESDALRAPWPKAVITSGRRSVAIALAIKKASGGHTRIIHFTDPRGYYRHFDLVVAMEHDHVARANVISTRFALHRITPELLQAEAVKWGPRFAPMPRPLIAVLIGGTTNRYTMTHEAIEKVVEEIRGILAREEGSVLITPSRRTGEENIARLQQAFAGNPRVMVHDLNSENPYMGMLAVADYIVITNDSVNMMSEAYSTGKPLYILPLTGHENTKPARFAQALMKDGIARLLGERLQRWHYAVVDERARVVGVIKKVLAD